MIKSEGIRDENGNEYYADPVRMAFSLAGVVAAPEQTTTETTNARIEDTGQIIQVNRTIEGRDVLYAKIKQALEDFLGGTDSVQYITILSVWDRIISNLSTTEEAEV